MAGNDYMIYAVPKMGGDPFRSHEYDKLYTFAEAEKIIAKEKGGPVVYEIRSLTAPQETFLGPQGQHLPMEAEKEIARLRKVSERQSAMLAQALKEKNDLQGKVTATDADFYVKQIKALQLEVSSLKDRIRKGREAFNTLQSL